MNFLERQTLATLHSHVPYRGLPPSRPSSQENEFSIASYPQPNVIWKIDIVMRITGKGRTTIYNNMNSESSQYDPRFPKQIRLSLHGRAVGWLSNEIEAYIQALATANRCGIATTPGVLKSSSKPPSNSSKNGDFF